MSKVTAHHNVRMHYNRICHIHGRSISHSHQDSAHNQWGQVEGLVEAPFLQLWLAVLKEFTLTLFLKSQSFIRHPPPKLSDPGFLKFQSSWHLCAFCHPKYHIHHSCASSHFSVIPMSEWWRRFGVRTDADYWLKLYMQDYQEKT